MNNTQRRRATSGLCIDCGKARGADGTTMLCRPCAKRASSFASKRTTRIRADRHANGLCIVCNQPFEGEARECPTCAENRRTYHVDHYARRIRPRIEDRKKRGVCRLCGNPRYHAALLCRRHYAGEVARDYGVLTESGLVLLDRLEASGFRCFYTGISIVPGENASLDHANPRNGEKDTRGDISNLVWCDREINRMKGARTVSEFIDVCRAIAEFVSPFKPVEGHRTKRPGEAGTSLELAA